MTGGPARRMSQKASLPGSQARPVQKQKKEKKEKTEPKATKEADGREKSDREVTFAEPSDPEKKREKKTKPLATSEVPSPSVLKVQQASVKAEQSTARQRAFPLLLPSLPEMILEVFS